MMARMIRLPLFAALSSLAMLCASCGDSTSTTAPQPGLDGSAGSGGTGNTEGGTGTGGTSGTDAAPPLPSCDPPDPSVGFHATLTGTPEGDGTLASPWDLRTALNAPPGVGPGDTIWIHEGRYEGSFVVKQDGTDGAPVTVRAWPGDRVTLDGASAPSEPVIQFYHQWMVIRDLEITNSNPDRRTDRPTGIYVGADHIVLANLAVHDVGVGISGGQLTGDGTQEGTDITLYGSLFYNNGWLGTDRGHGHHTYLTNRDSMIRMEENVFFYAYGFGVHNYSASDNNYVRNYELVGNVWFLNGVPGGKLTDNCMIGHDGTLTASGMTLRENFGWATGLGERDVRLGWDTPNEDATLTDNYFVGQTIFQNQWTGIAMDGNTFIGSVEGVDPASYPNNTYVDARPTQNHIVLRPNGYEPGRAHIIAYNWEGLDELAVDLSPVVPNGTAFGIYDAQNPFAGPVVSGAYEGGTVAIPVDGLPIAMPTGDPEAIPADQRTGRDFNVFVLRAAVCE